jgi:hypothetical protein
MIREKEKNNKEGQRYRLKKFEEEGYREAVSSISNLSNVFETIKMLGYQIGISVILAKYGLSQCIPMRIYSW